MYEFVPLELRAPNATPDEQKLYRGFVAHGREHLATLGELARGVARAVIAAGPEVFDRAELKYAEQAANYDRLTHALELMQKRELDRSRALVEQVLAEDPNQPDALFLDARLAWLEDSPAACTAKLDHALTRLTTVHSPKLRPARAKLLNLYGCALDEQGRYDEALPWFERASGEDPEAGIYMANLAEIHEKLGHMDQAVRWATNARNAGFSSALVSRLTESAEA